MYSTLKEIVQLLLQLLKKLFSRKLIIRLYLPLLILVGIVMYICYQRVEKNALGKTYFDVEKLPHKHVGLLLGTCKYMRDKKTINPFWNFRLQAAYQLWKAGKIDKILISGDNGWYGYNEPKDFFDALKKLGVPDTAMVCDYAGFRTHDSVIRCKKVFGQQDIIIISQQFHNERALYIAKYYGVKALGYNAEQVSFRDNLWNAVRESLARVKLHLDIFVLHTQPHFLGPKIFI